MKALRDWFRGRRIRGWITVVGSCFGILGTLVAASDRMDSTHRWLSELQPWKNINLLLYNLNIVTTAEPTWQDVKIKEGMPGFEDLVGIIKSNCPKLLNVEIKGLYSLSTVQSVQDGEPDVGMGVVYALVINSLVPNQLSPRQVCWDRTLFEWARSFQQQWFTSWGVTISFLGFLVVVLSRYTKAPVPDPKTPESGGETMSGKTFAEALQPPSKTPSDGEKL